MKSAKAQAELLVNKFLGIDTRVYEECGWAGININTAKNCATICIDEILDEYESMSDLESIIKINGIWFTVVELIKFYRQVKDEIKKL